MRTLKGGGSKIFQRHVLNVLKHLEKFHNGFKGHPVFMNIHPRKEERYYTS